MTFQNTSTPQPPWHLWGGSETLTFRTAAPGPGVPPPLIASNQLAKISYRRPENWTFFFGARVIDSPINTDPINFYYIGVRYDLVLGVGRSSFDTANPPIVFTAEPLPYGEGFAQFIFPAEPGARASQQPKWTTVVRAPFNIDNSWDIDPNGADQTYQRPLIDSFPAQDIQCRATAYNVQNIPVSSTITVEVSAFFSPRVHARPDWFVKKFAGAETGGT